MSTAAPEYLTTLRDGFTDAVQQWMDQSATAWDQWSQAWSPAVAAVGLRMPGAPGGTPGHRSRESHHRGETGCGCHDRCGDGCDCCVPEADVVVRARAGELRVVPFRLRNPWRRERPVTLEVGPWHGCSRDDLAIRAVLEDTKVVLGPCEDRIVRLLISTRGTLDDDSRMEGQDLTGGGAEADAAGKPSQAARAAGREPVDVAAVPTRRTSDVDSCLSAYADVRFEGCARPQRVAVVVLPAECDALDVGCDCGCCC